MSCAAMNSHKAVHVSIREFHSLLVSVHDGFFLIARETIDVADLHFDPSDKDMPTKRYGVMKDLTHCGQEQ